jgi:hypothetical protein
MEYEQEMKLLSSSSDDDEAVLFGGDAESKGEVMVAPLPAEDADILEDELRADPYFAYFETLPTIAHLMTMTDGLLMSVKKQLPLPDQAALSPEDAQKLFTSLQTNVTRVSQQDTVSVKPSYFNNPVIFEQLLKQFAIKQAGSNFSRKVYDHDLAPTEMYEVLNSMQKAAEKASMAKRTPSTPMERQRESRPLPSSSTKRSLSSTLRTAGEDDKSKSSSKASKTKASSSSSHSGSSSKRVARESSTEADPPPLPGKTSAPPPLPSSSATPVSSSGSGSPNTKRRKLEV